MRNSRLRRFLISASLLFAACNVSVHEGESVVLDRNGFGQVVTGEGEVLKEDRAAGGFTEVTVNGASRLEWQPDSVSRIEVYAQKDVLPLIRTDVENGVLLVSSEESYSTEEAVTVKIVSPELTKLTLNGSGSAAVQGLKTGGFALVVQGSSDVALSGAVQKLNILVAGSGEIQANALEAVEVDVQLNGSGTATVKAIDKLSVRISGSGSVRYVGEPKSIDRKILGSGQIKKAD